MSNEEFEWVAENLKRSKKSKIYHLHAKVNGRLVRRSLKTKQRDPAKIARDRILAQLKSEAVLASGEHVDSLEEAVRVAVERKATRPGLKTASIAWWRDIGTSALAVARVDLSAKKCGPVVFREWWSAVAAKYSAAYANSCLLVIRAVGELLVELGMFLESPASDLRRMPRARKVLEIITREEFDEVLASMREQRKSTSEEAATMCEVLAYSGLRIAELQALTWEDVRGEELIVRGGAEGTKNRSERRVPIVAPLRDVLARWRRQGASGPLFELKTPRFGLAGACERLGLPHQRVHDLRHMFATLCIESGVDIPTVARWMGHRDGGALALRTYSHLRDDHSKRAAALVRR